ncbi:hypothetical protein AVEN_529-1 [Araneus ventricosus]|uniref:Peptidase aspartic putative domain-containing protein n=1 Tax=Araneus ventricosus TaxID=182803 RepID=A0A4Y2SHR3_ARAVE|nr:hypothetical protein AVEN_529-1 [Araneus ventricosus]
MCYDENKRSDNEKRESKEVTENTTLANNSCSREVYLQTLIAYIKENNLKHFIRVIIDMGSQRSYISKFTARKMKLKGLGEECVNHGLFGGIEHTETHQRYRINLSNIDGSYNFELDVLDEKKICASLPKMNDAHCLNQLKDMGILISDAAINERSCLYEKNLGEIHLLIGADYAVETVQDSSGAVEEKEVTVLGLTWDREENTLSCELIRTENEDEPITKRKILSVAHQLFDPIGFTCPITLIPKLLLQECWKLGISWDSKLSEDAINKFKKMER